MQMPKNAGSKLRRLFSTQQRRTSRLMLGIEGVLRGRVTWHDSDGLDGNSTGRESARSPTLKWR